MFDTIKIVFIIIVTAYSVLGQAVTIHNIDVDSIDSRHKKIIEFGANTYNLKLSSLGNNPSYSVANLEYENNTDPLALLISKHVGDFDLVFNKTFSTSKYTVDGYYRKRHLISDYANSYYLKINNKETNQTNSLIINFSNEPDTETMFTWQFAFKDLYSRIFIHNDILYFTAIGDHQDNLYLIKINLLNNKIIESSKFNMNKTVEQLEIIHSYNVHPIDYSTFFFTQTNQIYKISVPDISIKKYTFPEGFHTLDVIKDNDSYILALISDKDNVYLINTDNQLKKINWSYQLDMKEIGISNLFDKSRIFKKNDKLLFVPLLNSLYNFRYSYIIELDYFDKLRSSAWRFNGEFQDIRKINDDHFKITGTVNKDYNESDEAIFYGDLFFDGRGECGLDTACLQIDTLDNFTITAIDDIVFEEADITLEEATIEIDSTTFSTSPLACKDYKHNITGEFALLNDTICYSELPYIFEYETGYYDSSHWKIFLNDSLVYSESIEVPDLYSLELKEGKIFMQHLLLISGCENYHEDSIILVKENPIHILSDKESICTDESALLSIVNTGVSPGISTSWYNHKMENIGTGDSIRIYEPGTYEARIDNGFCQWSETITIGQLRDDCGSSIYIPTAFTPNRDDNNDTWTVFSSFPLEVVIEIYDRWGERVYSCEGTDCAWDGTFKEQDMPTGIYVYKVEATILETGETFRETGTLELLR